jgi:hypothetical protein
MLVRDSYSKHLFRISYSILKFIFLIVNNLIYNQLRFGCAEKLINLMLIASIKLTIVVKQQIQF